MSTTWDPKQYLRFESERARPFTDLVNRIEGPPPETVVDLGCGPGNMTAELSDRWPDARVTGIDNSAQMIARASELTRPGRLEFHEGDLTEWQPDAPVDVIVSAATLQWVPGHLELLPRFLGFLAPGGCLAFQVPGNFSSHSYVVVRELALSDRWQERLGGAVASFASSHEPAVYLRTLLDTSGTEWADVWETTYLHQLSGPDPVLEWVKSTALRPLLDLLQDRPGDQEEFLAAYAASLRASYPKDRAGRTIFPFRRIFGIARSR